MAGFGDHKKSQKKIKKNLKNNYFKEQIIHNAFKFHTEGNISEAIKYYKYFIHKSKKCGLKVFTFSQKNCRADILFLKQIKYKNNYLFKIKIKEIIKTFLIPNELLNYRENILASLSIIINYFDAQKLNKNLLVGFKVPKSRGSLTTYKKGSKKLQSLH